jgi:precorrin-2 dehydrogenase/sirohydrochlorin ferrochelatase
MNRYYPAFLDLTGKDVLVVGAGPVALQKVEALIPTGACVSVVALQAVPKIRSLARRGKIGLELRAFRPSDVAGRALVFCATADENLNARVSAECRRRRIWANIVDRTPLCDFIVPAVVQRGEVVFAVSTGGTSPALAKVLRRRIEREFGPEVAEAAATLKRYRRRILQIPMAERIVKLEGIVNDRALALLKQGKKNHLSGLLARCLKER